MNVSVCACVLKALRLTSQNVQFRSSAGGKQPLDCDFFFFFIKSNVGEKEMLGIVQ